MKKFLVLSSLLFVPMFASAATVGSVLKVFSDTINAVIPIILALAVLYFFWGLAKYVLNSANEDAKEEGRNIMIWGIIALFVMVSVWGLIALLQDTFDVDSQSPIIPGKIERSGGGNYGGSGTIAI